MKTTTDGLTEDEFCACVILSTEINALSHKRAPGQVTVGDCVPIVRSLATARAAEYPAQPIYDFTGAYMADPKCFMELDHDGQVLLMKDIAENVGWHVSKNPLPDALDREVAVARELARLHFDRREWWGACTKAERTAWLVEKYWPQWRNDAASIIALLAPAPTLKPGEAYMKATLDVPGNGTKP